MPTQATHAEPCRCTRACLCAPCWRDLERSMTEGELRRWLASWSHVDASNDGLDQESRSPAPAALGAVRS
jgi:hypothetical protein